MKFDVNPAAKHEFTVVCSECGKVAGTLRCNRFTKKALDVNSSFVCSACSGGKS